MPEWKLDKAQKLRANWPDEALRKAFVAVAEADEGVKGGAADAAYALERGVFAIVGRPRGPSLATQKAAIPKDDGRLPEALRDARARRPAWPSPTSCWRPGWRG